MGSRELGQSLLHVFLVLTHLQGVDDAHVHAGLARVVQEGAVEATADRLVAAEAESNVGDAAADLAARADALDLRGGLDEVNGVVVVLGETGADGEDVGVEDDVLGVVANILDQDVVRTAADPDLQASRGTSVNLDSRQNVAADVPP